MQEDNIRMFIIFRKILVLLGKDRLNDLNGMSTCVGLFYAKRFKNHTHCTFIFTFIVYLFLKSFVHTVILDITLDVRSSSFFAPK